MRTHILITSLLLLVPVAAGCARARASTVDGDAAPPSAAAGVAGSCPDAGAMLPAGAGTMADRNGDGYVCTRLVRSIAGDTMRLTVDNDVLNADRARVEPDAYRGM